MGVIDDQGLLKTVVNSVVPGSIGDVIGKIKPGMLFEKNQVFVDFICGQHCLYMYFKK